MHREQPHDRDSFQAAGPPAGAWERLWSGRLQETKRHLAQSDAELRPVFLLSDIHSSRSRGAGRGPPERETAWGPGRHHTLCPPSLAPQCADLSSLSRAPGAPERQPGPKSQLQKGLWEAAQDGLVAQRTRRTRAARPQGPVRPVLLGGLLCVQQLEKGSGVSVGSLRARPPRSMPPGVPGGLPGPLLTAVSRPLARGHFRAVLANPPADRHLGFLPSCPAAVTLGRVTGSANAREHTGATCTAFPPARR